MTGSIGENLRHLRRRISLLERKYARDAGSVQLIAVSKTRGAAEIAQARTIGQRDFGENYLREARDKQHQLAGEDLCWHFIGPIQSNKTRDLATAFDWVHSVERDKVARRLSEQRPAELQPLKILLQVNLSGEASKAGVALEAVPDLAARIRQYSRLSLRGLMAIPAPGGDLEAQRRVFRHLAEARDDLLARGFEQCRHLSMGMSGDYEAAIAEGATMVRIGTAIFGPRP